MNERVIGVLVMAYGGPNNLADIPAYLLDVREGRPTSPELIEEITTNYRRIGGKSPILELTTQQAKQLEQQLNSTAPAGTHYQVYVGMRHWSPWINDAVSEMRADGIEHAIALVMSPYYSFMSIPKYFKRLDEALAFYSYPLEYAAIESYHNHPLLIQAFVNRVQEGLATMPADTHVIFSAHSLPKRIIEAGDPYDTQLHETAQLIAEQAGLTEGQWSFCYQSAGRSPEPWLGPQLDDHIIALANQGHQHLLSVVIGFVCDHVEILFDIDIRAQEVARLHHIELKRTPSLNSDPLFIQTLADLIHQKESELV